MIAIEAESIQNLATMLDEDFDRSAHCASTAKVASLFAALVNRVIGAKIASTLASTARLLFAPGEAIHGDLGILRHEMWS